MTTRINVSVCGLLLLVLAGAWATWKDIAPREAWILEDPARILTDFTPEETLDVSFRLRNTARVPLRIFGAGTC